jgi:hypothetical protein
MVNRFFAKRLNKRVAVVKSSLKVTNQCAGVNPYRAGQKTRCHQNDYVLIDMKIAVHKIFYPTSNNFLPVPKPFRIPLRPIQVDNRSCKGAQLNPYLTGS